MEPLQVATLGASKYQAEWALLVEEDILDVRECVARTSLGHTHRVVSKEFMKLQPTPSRLK
jgi:hypothetical protein